MHGCTHYETPTVTLRRLANGYQVTQAIHVAAALGIADLLRDGPRDSDALAQETATHAPSLHRVLRALASVGVLHEDDDGRFALTAIGECLRSDAAEPVGAWAAFVGRPYHWQAWGALLHGVRTGESPFRSVHGTDVWDYRAAHPEEDAIFNAAMTDIMRRANAHLLAAYDFGRFATVVDVGGGRGAFLGAILEANPGDARRALRPAARGRGRDPRRALRGRRRQLLRGGARGRRRLPAQGRPARLGGRRRAARSCALPRGDPATTARCSSSSATSARPTRTPTPSSPTSTCWSAPAGASARATSSPRCSPPAAFALTQRDAQRDRTERVRGAAGLSGRVVTRRAGVEPSAARPRRSDSLRGPAGHLAPSVCARPYLATPRRKDREHARTRRDQRLRPHRPQRLPRRHRPRRPTSSGSPSTTSPTTPRSRTC